MWCSAQSFHTLPETLTIHPDQHTGSRAGAADKKHLFRCIEAVVVVVTLKMKTVPISLPQVPSSVRADPPT